MATYLTRTCSAGSFNTKYTVSFWFKLTEADDTKEQYIYMGGDQTTSNNLWIRLQGTSRTLYLRSRTGGSNDIVLITNRVFRDSSAWYHIVYEIDTTLSTASDRVKLYINGVQETSFGTETYPAQNTTVKISNNGDDMDIGRRTDGSGYSDMHLLLAHYYIIDGTAYDASAFGETDSNSGIWKPKFSPSVNYGTNGFFLKFQDSSSLGDDSSGNNNDFTLSGSGTQTLDTPSNVFATWNPLNQNLSYATTLAYGNTDIDSQNNTGQFQNTSTFGVSKGKWYMEIKSKSNGQNCFGITSNPGFHALNNYYIGQTTFSWGYVEANGNKINNDSTVQSGNSFTSGDIIGIAMDLDNSKLYFSKNGTWENSADPVAGTGGLSITANETYFFGCSDVTGSTSAKSSANFGNGYFQATAVSSAENDDAGYGKFEYDVPTGYYALCTKNINTYG